MEAQGGIGSVGSYDLKLEAGVASVMVGAKIDLAAELEKLAAGLDNAVEKALLMGAAAVLRKL